MEALRLGLRAVLQTLRRQRRPDLGPWRARLAPDALRASFHAGGHPRGQPDFASLAEIFQRRRVRHADLPRPRPVRGRVAQRHVHAALCDGRGWPPDVSFRGSDRVLWAVAGAGQVLGSPQRKLLQHD
ncbi:hypothetical protein M885DRAFT_524891 [Pelagophyceae sp. CCMP2097]|nr:hypothetical protein M885DRAFT_524891 [Pelagophyceae sp. CCMP2097]